MSSIAQRCNWKTSEGKGAHKSRRFHSIFLPFYYQKINPGRWDVKSWPPLIYYTSLCLPWSGTLEGGLKGGRPLSWGRIMKHSGGKRGQRENNTSQQHSRAVLGPLPMTPCCVYLGHEHWPVAEWGLKWGRCFYLKKPCSPCPTTAPALVEKTISFMVRERMWERMLS